MRVGFRSFRFVMKPETKRNENSSQRTEIFVSFQTFKTKRNETKRKTNRNETINETAPMTSSITQNFVEMAQIFAQIRHI